MKPKSILIVSILLNLLLLAVVFFKSSHSLPQENPVPVPVQPNANSTPGEYAARTAALVITNSLNLDWRSIESGDYKLYIKNLRNANCPDETVCDIIIADVNKLYAARWQALAVPKGWKYWVGEDGLLQNAALQKERRGLEKERDALIKDLLGIDYRTEIQKLSFWHVDNREAKLAFLSEEKRNQIKKLLDKYQLLRQDLYQDGRSDTKKMKELGAQETSEIAQLLTPDEWENYQMRFSPWSNGMRQGLADVTVTEEEFKNLFRQSKPFTDELDQLDYDADYDSAIKRNQAISKSLSDQAKNILGNQRFADYERGRSQDFREALRLTGQFDLLRDAAIKIYDTKKAFDDMSQKLRTDQTLSVEQRKQQTKAIQAEAAQTLSNVLGEEAYKAYKRQNSHWLQ